MKNIEQTRKILRDRILKEHKVVELNFELYVNVDNADDYISDMSYLDVYIDALESIWESYSITASVQKMVQTFEVVKKGAMDYYDDIDAHDYINRITYRIIEGDK